MKPNRPVLKLPMTKVEWALELMTLSMVVITVAVVAFYWSSLPEQITVHFDITGKPDRQGGKTTLLFLSGITVVDYLLMTILARFLHAFNYLRPITEKNAASQYLLARKFLAVMKLETTGIMFFAISSCIQVSIGATKAIDPSTLITLLVVLFISVAIYMFQARKAD
jgi:uncharacterized membrane protein